MSRPVLEDELRTMSCYKRRSDVERWLRKNRISYFRGRGGSLSTTLSLIEQAKQPKKPEGDTVEF